MQRDRKHYFWDNVNIVMCNVVIGCIALYINIYSIVVCDASVATDSYVLFEFDIFQQ